MMFCHVLAFLCLLAPAATLTDKQLAKFGTSGVVEPITGVAGWVNVSVNSDILTITGNGVPDHDVGSSPRNNATEQSYEISVNNAPSIESAVSCLGAGPIALTKGGVALYNAYTSSYTDAVVNANFDSCNGHADGQGRYHYHQHPICITTGTGREFVGVAYDGFPIYKTTKPNGDELTNADDLDECHGRYVSGNYRYEINSEFPYVLGCFRGTPTQQRGACFYFFNNATGTVQA